MSTYWFKDVTLGVNWVKKTGDYFVVVFYNFLIYSYFKIKKKLKRKQLPTITVKII